MSRDLVAALCTLILTLGFLVVEVSATEDPPSSPTVTEMGPSIEPNG